MYTLMHEQAVLAGGEMVTHLLEPVGKAAIFFLSEESLPMLVDTWPWGGEGHPRVMDW